MTAAQAPARRLARAAESDAVRRRFMIVMAAVIAVLWLAPIGSSFWLDEGGTYWVVRDGFGEAIDRAARFTGQTPLYYALIWGWKQVAGASEIALRLPSLAAMVLSLWLLHRLALRLFGREAAWLSVVAFATSRGVPFLAIEARPYALAIAALLGSTLVLVRWLDEGSRRDALLYPVLVALIVYFHYLIALPLLAHALYAWRRTREGGRVPFSAWIVAAVAGAALSGPAWFQLLSLFGRRDTLTYGTTTPLPELYDVIAPGAVVLGLGLGFVLSRLRGPTHIEGAPSHAGAFWLVLPWVLTAPVVLWIVTQGQYGILFAQRYRSSALPGLALLIGWALSCLHPARARRTALAVLVTLSLIAFAGLHHNEENWRAAAAVVRGLGIDGSTPVIVQGGFVESAQIDWLDDPERADYLLAPIWPYRMPGRPVPTPFLLDAEGERYLERLVTGTLARTERFVYVGRRREPFDDWLAARTRGMGFQRVRAGRGGSLEVWLFERPSP